MIAIGEKRLRGAVFLIIIAITICGMEYVSQQLKKNCAVLSYTTQEPNLLTVELSGDTDRKGIYNLKKHAAVSDLLLKAGLLNDVYRQDDVNAGLHHGDKVTIDLGVDRNHSRIRIEGMEAADRYVLDMAMDLNSAATDDLQLVPGVGKRCAEEIVAMRERIGGFREIDELQKIPVFRGRKYEKIKKYFFIQEAT